MPRKKPKHCEICGEDDGHIRSFVVMIHGRKRAGFYTCRSCRHALMWQLGNPLRRK